MIKNKRARKPTAKIMENGAAVRIPEKSLWCTVELENRDGSKKEHLVCSKYLETESGEPVTAVDLFFENRVIWLHKHTPYQATILEVHRNKPIKQVDQLSDTEDDTKPPQRKKPVKHMASTTNAEEPTPPIKRPRLNKIVSSDDDSSDEDGFKDEMRCADDENDLQDEMHGCTRVDHEEEITSDTTPLPAKGSSLQQDNHAIPFCNTPKRVMPLLKNGKTDDKKKVKDNQFSIPFCNTPKTVTPVLSDTPKDDDSRNIKERLASIENKLDYILGLLNNDHARKKVVASCKEEDNKQFITDNGVNLLKIRAVDPVKYALHLMDVLFTEEEMAASCYTSSSRSTKPGLNDDKIRLLEDCVKKVFTEKSFAEKAKSIKRSCTQKCLDKASKLKKSND